MNTKQRTDLLHKILGQVREGEYPYEERPKKPISWSNYDIAQCREIVDMLAMFRELVDEAVKRINARKPKIASGPGRPPTAPADIAKVLMMQSYFGVPNRPAEGLLILFSERLGISKDFSYKTIERGYDRESVMEILDEVFSLSNEPVQGLETVFSIDGSGSPTSNKQNYAKDRQRQRNKISKNAEKVEWPKSVPAAPSDYQYHVGVIGTVYKMFASWESTSDHSIGELSMYQHALMNAIYNQPGMEKILGDGIYATRPACNLAGENHVTPVFLPRRNSTFKRKCSDAWVRMLLRIVNDPQNWLSDYHMRSISETGFSMLARSNPNTIRKHLPQRRITEDYLRTIVHNGKRLCYLRYLVNLRVDFSRRGAG